MAAPVSQSLSQVANARVNRVLAPQLAQQTSYGAHQNAVIRAFANSLLGRLQPIAGQVGGDYDAAIKQIGGLSANAASYLSGQSPAASQQALLSSVNAPASQQAQSQQQLGDTFNGGAGVLSFTQGVVPGSELAGNKAAAMAQARALPAIGALAGQQSLASALYTQSQSRDKLLATRPQLVQQQENVIQKNNIARAGIKQKADAAAAKLTADANKIDVGVSKIRGVLSHSDGTPVKDVKGNTIPVAGASAKSTFRTDKYGRLLEIGPDDSITVRSSGVWTDPNTGTTYDVGLDGKRTVFSTKPAKTPTPNTQIVTLGKQQWLVDKATGARIQYVGPAAAGSASTSAPTVRNGRQWDPKTRRWVKAPGLPAPSGPGGVKPPTASEIAAQVQLWKVGKPTSITRPVIDPKTGQPATSATTGRPLTSTKTETTGTLSYLPAYKRLRAQGVPDRAARKYLDTAWQRGEQGRAWLSNEEQAALKRAGLRPRVTVVNGHPVLSPAQLAALRLAKRVPPGTLYDNGNFVVAQTY